MVLLRSLAERQIHKKIEASNRMEEELNKKRVETTFSLDFCVERQLSLAHDIEWEEFYS